MLRRAARESGLTDPFVHVRELGEYSIRYRVAGLLEKVGSLISARSRLREAKLDSLHAAEIEIVSPSFMNQRIVSQCRDQFVEPHARQSVSPACAHASMSQSCGTWMKRFVTGDMTRVTCPRPVRSSR